MKLLYFLLRIWYRYGLEYIPVKKRVWFIKMFLGIDVDSLWKRLDAIFKTELKK